MLSCSVDELVLWLQVELQVYRVESRRPGPLYKVAYSSTLLVGKTTAFDRTAQYLNTAAFVRDVRCLKAWLWLADHSFVLAQDCTFAIMNRKTSACHLHFSPHGRQTRSALH